MNKIKQQRIKRKNEKAQGIPRRMDAFDQIVKESGTNWTEIANKSQLITPQQLYYYRVEDDAPLGRLQSVFEAVGIRVEPQFENYPPTANKKNKTEEKYRFRVVGLGSRPGLRDLIVTAKEEKKRLAFLAELILALPSVTYFCQLTGLREKKIRNLFENDYIRISTIYHIAEKMNETVLWKVSSSM